jgi:hypothetical protein
MTATGNPALLDIARRRLVTHQAGQVRTCLQALNDGQLWWRANEESNAVGNLVLHLCGSTHFYIGHGVGNSGYVRNRDAEFAEPGPVAKSDLLARFDAAMTEADRVLSDVDPAHLDERPRRQDRDLRRAHPEPGASFHRPHRADRLRDKAHPDPDHPRSVENDAARVARITDTWEPKRPRHAAHSKRVC